MAKAVCYWTLLLLALCTCSAQVWLPPVGSLNGTSEVVGAASMQQEQKIDYAAVTAPHTGLPLTGISSDPKHLAFIPDFDESAAKGRVVMAGPSRGRYKPDGTLVAVGGGNAYTAAETATAAGDVGVQQAAMPDRIGNRECLVAADGPACIRSPNKQFKVCLLRSSNIVIYANRQAWQTTNTANSIPANQKPAKLCMQADGNLALYQKNGQAVWASNSKGSPAPMTAYIQNDGALAIYTADCNPIWTTGPRDVNKAVQPPCSTGGGGGSTPPPPDPPGGCSWCNEILTLVNAARTQNGNLAPLSLNKDLTAAAQKHSNDQFQAGIMAHELPGGPTFIARMQRDLSGYLACGIGENVAAGQTSVAQVHNDWMNSAGHRANILGSFKSMGIARVGNYWTEIFAGCTAPSG